MTELETLLLNSLQALDAESREREGRLLLQLNVLNDQLVASTAQAAALAQRSDALSKELRNLARQLSASEKRIENLTRHVERMTGLLS